MKVLVTGSAGFIGYHLVQKLAKTENTIIVGIDNINDYYDVHLKYDRLKETGIHKALIHANTAVQSQIYSNYTFYHADLSDYEVLSHIFEKERFDIVINMAAQAGVRYSIENPSVYIQSNIAGFTNILECCRHNHIKHLIYASSSSVYGINNNIPFSETDDTNYPVSLYAATKKSNELLAHVYSHLFHLPTTGVRLFTVYGPWGRPDMAPMLFAEAISSNRPIRLFNNGEMSRDFTYIDDIVRGIIGLLDNIPDQQNEHPFYRILNIGHSKPIDLMQFIATLEKSLGKCATFEMCPMQPGDVPVTYADTSLLQHQINYKPQVSVKEGVSIFIDWFLSWKGHIRNH